MIRSYKDSDYEQLKALYQQTELYGGVFDEARDSRERLGSKIAIRQKAFLEALLAQAEEAPMPCPHVGRIAVGLITLSQEQQFVLQAKASRFLAETTD